MQKYVLNVWLDVIIMLLTQGLNCVYSLMGVKGHYLLRSAPKTVENKWHYLLRSAPKTAANNHHLFAAVLGASRSK